MEHILLLLFLLLFTSCGFGEIGSGLHSGSDGIWHGPSYGKYMSGTCYAVGLDYPDGYDWRSDTEKGNVKCQLVMFADGIPVLKLPVGDTYEISSDIGRHRVRAGCLYTDYTDGNTTVIKKDGVEISRYDGAEDILCMEVYGGRLHFLTCPADGSGFRYRVDGQLILERKDAVPFLHLDEYADSVRFCFSQEQKTISGKETRYYQVTAGTVRNIELTDSITAVWDMRVMNGKVCVASSFPDKNPVLMYDQKREHLKYLDRQNVVSCVFSDSDRIGLCVRCVYSGSRSMSDILWTGGNDWQMYRIGRTLSSFCIDGDGCNASINPVNGQDGLIFKGSQANLMPAGYYVFTGDCMVRRDSILNVGLSSRNGRYPLLWRDGVLDTLNINGPVTCLR